MTIHKYIIDENIEKAAATEAPLNIEEQDSNEQDKQMLREAIIAELDATNLYEQMANNTKNNEIKKIMLDIAKEEKVHVGEFEKLLEMIDSEQIASIEEGKREATEKILME